MRKGAALVVAFSFITSGCLIKGWKKQHYGDSELVAEGEARTIPVGTRYEASFVPGAALTVALTEQKLCRTATFGNINRYKEWYREWTGTNIYLLLFSPLLFPISPYLIGSYIYNKRQMNKPGGKDRSIGEPAHVWSTDLEPCPGTEPVPAVGRTIALRADFANGAFGGLVWTAPVDAQGRYDFDADPVRAKVARIANMCGQGTVTAYDATEDPAAAEMGPEVQQTGVKNQFVSRFDTGSPDAPKQVAVRPWSASMAIAADGAPSFDGLGQYELQVAQGCYGVKVNECRNREDPAYRPACEETCARDRGTLDCLFAARESYARQGTEQKVREYVEMRKRNCQVGLNASPEDEQQCVTTCLDNALAGLCQ